MASVLKRVFTSCQFLCVPVRGAGTRVELLLFRRPRSRRAAREEPLEHRGLFTGLLKPVNDRVDRVAEQDRRCKWGVQEEEPVLFFHIGQGQPQLFLHSHHGCHRRTDGSGRLFGDSDRQISGPMQF